MKRVLVSVTNDLTTDQRVDKVSQTLIKQGFEVVLIGRSLPSSIPISRSYATRRMRLFFKSGPFFYGEYNIRLFFLLLFSKVDVLLANDLDTLLSNYLVSKLRGVPLVYDSHELYTEVPELINRPRVQAIWKKIEGYIFPKLQSVYTVNKSIADIYSAKYEVPVEVIKNLPNDSLLLKRKERKDLGIPANRKVVILQGAGINIDRGGEELIEAISLLPEFFLVVVGSGDVIDILKQRTIELNITNRVLFQSKVPYDEMMQYTLNADLGVTLDKDTNLNYRYSLPNKIFDYLKAGIPVLSSDLPEIRLVVEEFDVGAIVSSHNPNEIALAIRSLLSDEERILRCRENAKFAAAKLNWQSQEPLLMNIFKKFV